MSVTKPRATLNQSSGSLELQVLFDRGISNRHVNQGSILKPRDETPKQIVNPNSSFRPCVAAQFCDVALSKMEGFLQLVSYLLKIQFSLVQLECALRT